MDAAVAIVLKESKYEEMHKRFGLSKRSIE